jgi:hypothetical protein
MGLFQRDLRRRIFDLRDNPPEHDDVELARLVVYLDLGLDVRTVDSREPGHDPVLDQVVHLVDR